MTEITQADRDAAAQYDVVEAFARHRKYGYDQGYYDGRQLDGADERAAIVAMMWKDVQCDWMAEYHADILRDLMDRIQAGEHLK